MKKLLSVILAACLCCGMLAGCGSNGSKVKEEEVISDNVPEGIGPETYNNAKKVLEITDSFLNGDISAEKALDQLDEIDIIEYDDEYIESCEKDDDGFPIDKNIEYPKNPAINEAMRLIESFISFLADEYDETEIGFIKNMRDYIDENIN